MSDRGEVHPPNDPQTSERSAGIGELLERVSAQTSKLVRTEIALAKLELAQKAKQGGIGAALLGTAGVLVPYILTVLIFAAVAGLAVVWPWWLAALTVAGVLIIFAAILAAIGISRLQRSAPPTPETTQVTVKQDVASIKEGLHR